MGIEEKKRVEENIEKAEQNRRKQRTALKSKEQNKTEQRTGEERSERAESEACLVMQPGYRLQERRL